MKDLEFAHYKLFNYRR